MPSADFPTFTQFPDIAMRDMVGAVKWAVDAIRQGTLKEDPETAAWIGWNLAGYVALKFSDSNALAVQTEMSPEGLADACEAAFCVSRADGFDWSSLLTPENLRLLVDLARFILEAVF